MGTAYVTHTYILHGVQSSVKTLIAHLSNEHKWHRLLWNVSPLPGYGGCSKNISCMNLQAHVETNLFLPLLFP